MFKKGWKYLSPDDDPAPADPPPSDPPPSDPPPSDPPADPPAAKWQDNWRETYANGDEKKMGRLSRYATPAAAFDALLGLQNKISAGELRTILPKDATPEQIAEYRKEQGIPESWDKYDIKFGGDDGLPDQDKPVINSFLQAAHEKGLPNDAAKGMVDWYYETVAKQTEERMAKDKEFGKAAEDNLRAEWGAEYRANMNMVTGLLATAPESVRDLITTGRLGNGDPLLSHPDVLKWLNGMSREINPVTTVMPNAGANMANAIEDEIKDIEKLMRSNSPDYWKDDKKQARYRELLAAKEKLSSKAA